MTNGLELGKGNREVGCGGLITGGQLVTLAALSQHSVECGCPAEESCQHTKETSRERVVLLFSGAAGSPVVMSSPGGAC